MKNTKKKSFGYLLFISSVAAFGGLLFGYDSVVVSGTNSQIISLYHFTESQLGFYVSCVLWGCAVGSGIAGPIVDAMGRKKVLILSSLFIFISAFWSGFAMNVPNLIIARLIGGVGIGMATMVCPLYISEVSPEKYRGRLVTLFQLTITIGIVLCVFANWGIFSYAESNVNNTHLSSFSKWFIVDQSWRMMFFAEIFPGIVFLICALFIPESPRWLMKNKERDKALSILTKINGDEAAKIICDDIYRVVKDEDTIRVKDLFTKKLRYPLILAVLLCVLSEGCGCSVIFYYGPMIFEKAGLSLNGSLGGFSIIAIVNFVTTIAGIFFIDSAGRRPLLAFGAFGAMLSMLSLGYMFSLGVNGWPIILGIIFYIGFFACAIGPVKYVVVSEIFPNKVRGKAIAFSTICIWITSATVAQLFPILEESLPAGYIYYIFAFILFLLLMLVKFVMIETKGRTIENIEEGWLKKNKI